MTPALPIRANTLFLRIFFAITLASGAATYTGFDAIAIAQGKKEATKPTDAKAAATSEPSAAATGAAGAVTVGEETFSGGPSIFERALEGGFVVFMVLVILVLLSIAAWAIVVVKWIGLGTHDKRSLAFIQTFWDSRSLNDLNSRLGEYPDSPAKELFRSGYSELVRASQMRDSATALELVLKAGMENMTRALAKAKITERSRIERYLPTLAITASAAPFIGLFGTVWGIMEAFEGIAQTGNASLSAVAPGISEALIAAAFGLAAAIPAAIGYNIFTARIRRVMMMLDGFSADFLNIVERYLASGKKSQSNQGSTL